MTDPTVRNEAGVVNIAAALTDRARERPDATAVACPAGRDRAGRSAYTHWTFRRLDRESDALALGLASIGIGRGVRTALMVKPGLDFFALTFALFKAGAVPVLIDPGMGMRNLGRCLDEARPDAFIGIPLAQLARRLLGWGKASIRTVVTVGRSSQRRLPSLPERPPVTHISLAEVRALGRSDVPFPLARTAPDETAAVLFTSGSTGPPKGAVYTHGIFAAQVSMLRDLYRIEPGEVDLCTFPLFALFAPALGMTSIVPEMDATRPAHVDPTKIIDAIESFGATNMFGSPALLKRVSDFGVEHGVTLPSLRRVVSAGAPVPARVMERFLTMLAPGVEVFTPYGATESLPVASIGSGEILGETRHATDLGAGVCVGCSVPGMTVRVIRITDGPIATTDDWQPVADGEIGEFVVQGPVVTRSYLNLADPERGEALTDLAKIREDRSEAPGPVIWHRMGDVGYCDPDGRLWFCGRKAHRVVIAEGTLFTIPCEAVFNTHPDVSRSALVGVGTPGSAKPVLCIEPKRWPLSRAERARVVRELSEIGGRFSHTSAIQTFLFCKAFPVDIRHNAKIFREKLAIWAARRI